MARDGDGGGGEGLTTKEEKNPESSVIEFVSFYTSPGSRADGVPRTARETRTRALIVRRIPPPIWHGMTKAGRMLQSPTSTRIAHVAALRMP
jgi:hypothetical protein